MTRRGWRLLLTILAYTFPAAGVGHPLANRVLVVYNSRSPESHAVANYYLQKRGVPAKNLCRIRFDDFRTLPWRDLQAKFLVPLLGCLTKAGRSEILYIVMAYNTPYRLENVPEGGGWAIDSFASDPWRESAPSKVRNPYYADAQSKAGIYPAFISLLDFRKEEGPAPVYSVWRLDAATPALARGLVDKAITAENLGLHGRGCFDRRYYEIQPLKDEGYSAGDWDIYRASQFAVEAGFPVLEDSNDEEFGTPPAPLRCDDAVFYAGWYSLNHYNDAFTWNTGAIGIHLDSASATDPRGGKNWSANAVQRGITVTSGAVAEPLLDALPHPDGILRNLLEGANVADAFLRNTAYLRWMIMNIGDPLYTPFPGGRSPFAVPPQASHPQP